MNYYNEFDPKSAAWLRELILAGLIPTGIVDTRSITEIQPHELKDFTQCHFFAGIGGWPLSLQLAGWPATRPVWTGSCPCQPFSAAGKQLGTADERHLWPVFFNLIRECHPEFVFGEQVASAIGKGWLDGVSADLEGAGYACGAAVLGAHSVGAPHIRQRLFWVADAAGASRAQHVGEPGSGARGQATAPDVTELGGGRGGLADANGQQTISSDTGRLHTEPGGSGWMGDAVRTGLEGRGRAVSSERGAFGQVESCCIPSDWSQFDSLSCSDGKARRIEPGLAPLAHGVPARVVRLRGYGNAIVPQVAAEFVGAFLDTQG